MDNAAAENDNPPGRPLATFAILTYNQEAYVREAIESAFSQTYEPLEIILSDDFSSDRTFEIMQEMAASYSGPHRVRLRRNEINFGTAQHVSVVGKLAQGKMIIIAAGDDISLPERSERIMDAWSSDGRKTSCVHSAAYVFSNAPDECKKIAARTSVLDSRQDVENWLRRDLLPFLSPTCAYAKELFDDFGPLTGGSIIEDGPMALRCLLSGRVVGIDAPLVKIRISEGSVGRNNSIRNPSRWNRFIMSQVICYSTKMNDLAKSDLDQGLMKELAEIYRKKIAVLSHFIVPPIGRPSFWWQCAFFMRYTLVYAAAAPVANRVHEAFNILGCTDNAAYAFLKRLAVSVLKRN